MFDVFFLSESKRKWLSVAGCIIQGICIMACLGAIGHASIFFLAHPVSYFLPMGYIYAVVGYCIVGLFAHLYIFSYFMDQRTLGTRWTDQKKARILSISLAGLLGVTVILIVVAMLFHLFSLTVFRDTLYTSMQNYEGKKNPDTQKKDKFYVDSIQTRFECCGVKGFAEWLADTSLHLQHLAKESSHTCGKVNFTGVKTRSLAANGSKERFRSCCKMDSVDCTPLYTLKSIPTTPHLHFKWMNKTSTKFYTHTCPEKFLLYSHTWPFILYSAIFFAGQLASFVIKRYLDTSIHNSFLQMKPLKTAPGWLLKYSPEKAEQYLVQAETFHKAELDFDDFYNQYMMEQLQLGIDIPSVKARDVPKDASPMVKMKRELLDRMTEVHMGFWKDDSLGTSRRYSTLYRYSPDTGLAVLDEAAFLGTSSSSSSDNEAQGDDPYFGTLTTNIPTGPSAAPAPTTITYS